MSEFIFKLPDLGEGTVEAEIVEWHVKPGDDVVEGQTIADVMTDKANVEVPAPVSGRVLRVSGEGFGIMVELSFGANLARWAKEEPDAPLVTHNGRTWTVAAFHRWTNQLARKYVELGVCRNDMVTIALPNGAEFLAAAFATWKAGGIPQPVSARLPKLERDAIIDLAKSALVVGSEEPTPNGAPTLPTGFMPDDSADDSDLPDIIDEDTFE